ncbi:hypothetical protein WG68_13835 [Arsukibacterium ikkense]|uniref:GlyGly-CTERM sorting domain-containing protein n=2 Tax=Arsukibacterium ikkense TaxID=336831 RepID=A0A0M2V5H3_9GAMM|nr:hypothetical protein WG68_13835 [Arsukibacterium ikkense]
MSSWANSVSTELRSQQQTSMQTAKVRSAAVNQSFQSDVWFHSIDISLARDDNSNGYFHQLYVEFDADTDRAYRQVFAEFSLTPDFGREHVYYTSSVFELFRQSSNDWLAVETDLQHRYPANFYLLTIRIFDANSGYLLAEASGYDLSALDALPLEDYQRDQVPTYSRVEVSAGGTGIAMLLGLCWLLIRRQEQVIG